MGGGAEGTGTPSSHDPRASDATSPSPAPPPTPGPSPQGGGEGDRHHLLVRVYYEDTDFSGFAYHGAYVRFLERGRTELLRAASVSQRDLHREAGGLSFVVRRMSLEFLKPAHMDDVLTIVTIPKEMRGASMLLAQEIRRGEELLLIADVLVAAVKGGRAVRIPDTLREALGQGPA